MLSAALIDNASCFYDCNRRFFLINLLFKRISTALHMPANSSSADENIRSMLALVCLNAGNFPLLLLLSTSYARE